MLLTIQTTPIEGWFPVAHFSSTSSCVSCNAVKGEEVVTPCPLTFCAENSGREQKKVCEYLWFCVQVMYLFWWAGKGNNLCKQTKCCYITSKTVFPVSPRCKTQRGSSFWLKAFLLSGQTGIQYFLYCSWTPMKITVECPKNFVLDKLLELNLSCKSDSSMSTYDNMQEAKQWMGGG